MARVPQKVIVGVGQTRGNFSDRPPEQRMTDIKAQSRPAGLRDTNGGFQHELPFEAGLATVLFWSTAAGSWRPEADVTDMVP